MQLSENCVPLNIYCSLYGETTEAINKRVQNGVWQQGVQIVKVDGVKERWVDLEEVNRWVRKYKISSAG